jgi:hypothetical protein
MDQRRGDEQLTRTPKLSVRRRPRRACEGPNLAGRRLVRRGGPAKISNCRDGLEGTDHDLVCSCSERLIRQVGFQQLGVRENDPELVVEPVEDLRKVSSTGVSDRSPGRLQFFRHPCARPMRPYRWAGHSRPRGYARGCPQRCGPTHQPCERTAPYRPRSSCRSCAGSHPPARTHAESTPFCVQEASLSPTPGRRLAAHCARKRFQFGYRPPSPVTLTGGSEISRAGVLDHPPPSCQNAVTS